MKLMDIIMTIKDHIKDHIKKNERKIPEISESTGATIQALRYAQQLQRLINNQGGENEIL